MKLIEQGEPIDYKVKKRIALKFKNNELPKVEAAVTYLAEIKPCVNPYTDTVMFEVSIMGKKHEYICGNCGVNFIAHKGMCSTCYVKQL